MTHPVISKKCTGKELCLKEAMKNCPTGVFAQEKGKVIVKYPEKCSNCRVCESLCEHGEIKVVDD